MRGWRFGPIEHEALAVKKQPLRRPYVEMSKPKLFVDEHEKPIDFAEPVLGDLEVERAGHVQAFQVIAPIKRDVIVAPRTRDRYRQLVLARALENPILHA